MLRRGAGWNRLRLGKRIRDQVFKSGFLALTYFLGQQNKLGLTEFIVGSSADLLWELFHQVCEIAPVRAFLILWGLPRLSMRRIGVHLMLVLIVWVNGLSILTWHLTSLRSLESDIRVLPWPAYGELLDLRIWLLLSFKVRAEVLDHCTSFFLRTVFGGCCMLLLCAHCLVLVELLVRLASVGQLLLGFQNVIDVFVSAWNFVIALDCQKFGGALRDWGDF